MSGQTNNNIFLGAPPRFIEALPLFSGVRSLALPVRSETEGAATLFTLSGTEESGGPALSAFTSENMLTPPFIRQGLAETAVLFFHAPGHSLFVFNPAHPQARAAVAPLKAARLEISLLAGFARSTGQSAEAELAAGNLHTAHYLYAMEAARDPGSAARFRMCSVMVELGLLQEAHDLLGPDPAAEAKLCLAAIHRKTGHAAQARALLADPSLASALQERRLMETAWLDLEEGREEQARKAFEKISATAADAAEPLYGLGIAMERIALKKGDKSLLSGAVTTLQSALSRPSPAAARMLVQLGSLHFRSGDLGQAEICYKRAAALAPAPGTMTGLALTLLKIGRHDEAAAVTCQVALSDPAAARRLVGAFPKDRTAALFPPPPQAQAPNRAAPPPPPPVFNPPRQQVPPPPPITNPWENHSRGAPPPPTGLDPAEPRISSVSARIRAYQEKQKVKADIKIETFRDVMEGNAAPTEAESRQDDFLSYAFKVASALEDELGRKVYFNLEGLNEVERRLRLRFLKSEDNPQVNIEIVRNSAAFLCQFLQERHRGRLLKMTEFDPWGWPMVFELPGRKFTSYPVQRVWRLLWEETVPEPGWLAKYADWVADKLKETDPPACGVGAVRAKSVSHPERLLDVMTEHRRMLALVSTLSETSNIELSYNGLAKLDAVMREKFKPEVPPSSDGWKLLRCFGHLLAALLIKEFRAEWYNADGNDGGWSLRMPWDTFVFPIGKVYKAAFKRESLTEYFEALMDEKIKSPGPSHP